VLEEKVRVEKLDKEDKIRHVIAVINMVIAKGQGRKKYCIRKGDWLT